MQGTRPTVLLVEDDPQARAVLSAQLASSGFAPSDVHDGAAAVEALVAHRPDAVCVEQALPAMSGLDLCEHIRRVPELEDLPVLMISDRALPEDLALAEEAGASAHLAKPFDGEQLGRAVWALLERRGVRVGRDGPPRFTLFEAIEADPRPVFPPRHRGEVPAPSELDEVRGFLRFGAIALLRYRALALAAFACVCLAGAAWLAWGPRVYFTRAVILAQRNQVIPNLANPRRAVPSESDAPTWAARETVLRRDDLVALVKQNDLVDHWEATRPGLLKLKDRLLRLVSKPPTEADRIEALVGTLARHLDIAVGQGTVTLSIEWPEATMAARLVESAQQNFLEARHAEEVGAISESIAILEQSTEKAGRTVEALLHAGALRADGPGGAGEGGATDALDAARLSALAEGKRKTIEDLETYRRKRLSELQVRLAEARTVYAPAHPAVLAAQESIAALSAESTQVAQLRREEADLRSRAAEESRVTIAPPVLRGAGRSEVNARPAEARPSSYSQERLRIEVDKYEELLDRLSAARTELESTRAAFGYRYSVVEPASVPRKRAAPKVLPFAARTLVLAVLAALAAAMGAQAMRGRLLSAWQVERQLGLPVLGELELAGKDTRK